MTRRKTPPDPTGSGTAGTTDNGTTGPTGDTGTQAATATSGTSATTGHKVTTGHTAKPPKTPPKGATPPIAPLSRNMVDNQIAGIQMHGDLLTVALAAPADQVNRTALLLGRTGNILPLGVLTSTDRPIFARLEYDGQDTFVRRVAAGIQLTGLVPTVEGTTPAVLIDLLDKKNAYQGIKLLGDRVHDSAMDLQLLYGSYQFFLINRVIDYLEARFADPYLTRKEMETLLNDFGPALIKLNEVLSKGPDRKGELTNLRQTAEGQANDALDEANLQEVIYQVHNDITPSRAALFQAAQRYLNQTQTAVVAGQPAQAAPAQASHAETSPKMIR
jgi:chromosome segregation and condensation protein ScpB